MQIKFTPTQ